MIKNIRVQTINGEGRSYVMNGRRKRFFGYQENLLTDKLDQLVAGKGVVSVSKRRFVGSKRVTLARGYDNRFHITTGPAKGAEFCEKGLALYTTGKTKISGDTATVFVKVSKS